MPATKKLYAYYPTTGLWLPLVGNATGQLVIDASNLFEDTPTDGETKKGPTSNWAYDHNAAKTGVHQAGANNLATDLDIATHAALDTGVHGSGANTLLDTGDLEDTPTDGETSKAPTSNWAYDHPGESTLVWKDASVRVMTDDNRTASVSWTDLDITSDTSADAKAAILELLIRADTIGTGDICSVEVRKNGTTPTDSPILRIHKDMVTVNNWFMATVICGLDTGQVLEYQISVGTNWQIDTIITLFAYFE